MSDSPVDLRDLLNKPLSDFPDMPDLPGGKYFYGKLIGMSAGHSAQKQTPYFRFGVRLTDAGKDVTPAELQKIADGGFSLADYQVYSDFYLTPNAMRMLRRFLTTIGFPDNVSFAEALSLDPATGNPTPDTIEKIRGLDVLCRTQPANDSGRVYSNLDSIAGTKREE